MSNKQKTILISFFILASVIGITLYAGFEKGVFQNDGLSSDISKNPNNTIELANQDRSLENPAISSESTLELESTLLDTRSEIIGSSNLHSTNPIAQIYEYETPLIDGIKEMAPNGSWDYDKMMKNIALWENLCTKELNESPTMIDGFSNPQSIYSKINLLCKNFSSRVSEIDDFIEVEIDESAAGISDRASLESSLDRLGPDSATRRAIYELSDALDNSNYARVVEIVWFLGIYQFDGVSEEFQIYTNRPKVETIFSVAASIHCNYIGGCHGKHPVTLNLCFQFEDLPCSRPPNDIFDSINQILTGHEIDTFNQMNSSLVRLLNQYHRGEL